MPISIMKVCLLLAVCTHLPQLAEGVGKRSQKGALDLYCERENCYEVLGLDNTATKKEIKRSFRAISSKHHPDKKSKDPESPKIFAAAANAYEILTNDETRKNYDYYLAHPHEHATNQFAYYAMAAKKINVTPILICLILVLTIIGYISRQFTYDSAVTNWKAQKRVIGRARREALKVLGPYKGKSRNGHEKELIEKEAEKWMNEQIEGHKIQEFPVKPDFHSLFAVQLLKFPYTLYQKCVWYHGFRRRLNGNSLTLEDEEYLTYNALGKQERWWKMKKSFEAEEAKKLLEKRLWEADNLEKYKNSSEYLTTFGQDLTGLSKGLKKQYKRYLKRQRRAGQVYLEPED